MTHRSSSGLTAGSGASAAVPVPAGAASGDIVVVGIYKENGNAVTAPDGTWAQKAALTTSATARGSLYVFWKRLTAADTGTYTFTWTGSVWRGAAAAAHSGRVATGDPFDGTVGTNENTATGTTLNVSTSPAAANGDAVGFWTDFSGGAAWSPQAGYTERQDLDVITLDTADAVAAGSTGNVSATSTISGFMKAFLGVLAAATGGGNSQAITPAAETDTGVTPGRARSTAITSAAETDAGVSPAAARSTTVTPATETDTAITPAAARSTPITPASETDTAITPGHPGGAVVTPASETDVALSPARLRSLAVVAAQETDQAVTPAQTRTQAIQTAQETDAGVTPGNPNAVVRDLDLVVVLEPARFRTELEPMRFGTVIEPARFRTEIEP